MGLHTLLIAIDGVDATTFNQYRVGTDFEKVVRGLQRLLEHRPFNLEVIWQFIVMRHNEHQVDVAKAIAQKLNIPFALKAVSLDMLPLGNAQTQSIRDIWNSADLQRLRQRL